MKRMLSLFALASAAPLAIAQAQPTGGLVSIKSDAPSTPPAAELQPTVIILRPAPEPIPALKYRLEPERRSLIPGNAAIFYHRGIQQVIEKRLRLANQEHAEKTEPEYPGRKPTADEQIASWIAGPIAEIPREEAAELLRIFAPALQEVGQATLRSSCDWEFDQRTEGVYLLIPEIQEVRALARLVSLQARLAILDGKTDEAMHWIVAGMTMGRHTARGPLLIQALVGLAIDSLMLECLGELIQVPGTPSLYWALADRPRPFVDLRQALAYEHDILERELPELEELDRDPWGPHQTLRFIDAIRRKLLPLASGEPSPNTKANAPEDLSALATRLGIAAMAAKIYPEAKKALIARGRPEAQVEAMPVIQIAGLYSLQEYRRLNDDSYKWMNLPYWQSHGRIDQQFANNAEDIVANPLLATFRALTPAIRSARLAALRVERKLDALQCIEAIRLHANANDGKLPVSVEVIAEVPTPIDPATGKAFLYESHGRSATLAAPIPAGAPNQPAYAIRYELRLAD